MEKIINKIIQNDYEIKLSANSDIQSISYVNGLNRETLCFTHTQMKENVENRERRKKLGT